MEPVLHIPAHVNVLVANLKLHLRRLWVTFLHIVPSAAAWNIYTNVVGLFALGILCAVELPATVILLDLGKNVIYVAADGRVTVNDGFGIERYTMGCKIRTIGNFTVAHSGTAWNGVTNFDAWQILNSIQAGSVSDFAEQAEVRLRKEAEKFYMVEQATPGIDVTMDIVVAAFENGNPKAERVTLARELGKSVIIQRDTSYDKFLASLPPDSKTGSMFPLARRWLPEVDACLKLSTTADMLRCGLGVYIKADPLHINQPIAIRKLTKDGATWIEQGNCESR